MLNDTEVAIIGGGAAGIGAARRLHDAGVPCLIVEARSRLGGRAWTVDRARRLCARPWLRLAAFRRPQPVDARSPSGRGAASIARRRRGCGSPSTTASRTMSSAAFVAAQHAFYERLEEAGEREPDRPASALLEPGNRWNNLMGAVATYVTGAEPDQRVDHRLRPL